MSKINKILNNIFIGNYDAALDENCLNQYDIKIIINCTKNNKKLESDRDYMQIPINDPPNFEDKEYLINNITKIINFIDIKIRENKNILFHCNHGSQRSPTIVALYLMHKFKFHYLDVCNFIKSQRKISFFGSINYLETLLYFDKILKNKKI